MPNDKDRAKSFPGENSETANLDDSFVFCHISAKNDSLSSLIESEPRKFSGSLIMLVNQGHDLHLEINLEEHILNPGSLVLIYPGNVVRILGRIPADFEAHALYYDTKFARGLNINLSSIAVPDTITKPRHTLQLTPDEIVTMSQFFGLLKNTASFSQENPQIVNSIASSLTSALFYQLVMFYHRRLPAVIADNSAIRISTRRNDYVREFIRLVHLHYIKERTVGFYAEKLYISPKYLSFLVKEATGRSAAAWIDQFVLMEAKNLLRFSGKNIQQIAYALNFPTQSSFGKYFKHLTGLSPSEYQKT